MKFDMGALETPLELDWPVKVSVPQPDGGVQEQEFKARFRLVPEEELLALGDGVEAAKAGLRKVVVGFGGEDASQFSPELLERMLGRPYVRLALNAAYAQFVTGLPAKN